MGVRKYNSIKVAREVTQHQQKISRRMEEEYKRNVLEEERRVKKERQEYFKKNGFWPKERDKDSDLIAALKQRTR